MTIDFVVEHIKENVPLGSSSKHVENWLGANKIKTFYVLKNFEHTGSVVMSKIPPDSVSKIVVARVPTSNSNDVKGEIQLHLIFNREEKLIYIYENPMYEFL